MQQPNYDFLQQETQYSKLYIELIEQARSEDRKKLKRTDPDYIYYENHHIQPSKLGGPDDKWNMVLLGGEHLTAHKYLYKHFKELDLKHQLYNCSRAYFAICSLDPSKLNERQVPSEDEWYEARKAFSETMVRNSNEIKIKEIETKSKLDKDGLSIYDHAEIKRRITLNSLNENGEPRYKEISRKRIKTKSKIIKHLGKSQLEIEAENLSKLMKEKYASGELKTPTSSIITIYDEVGDIMFECDGCFAKTCEENDLPFDALYSSYHNNGSRIYSKRKPTKEKYNKYIGWYAIKSYPTHSKSNTGFSKSLSL